MKLSLLPNFPEIYPVHYLIFRLNKNNTSNVNKDYRNEQFFLIDNIIGNHTITVELHYYNRTANLHAVFLQLTLFFLFD